jgi:hypothetical protein
MSISKNPEYRRYLTIPPCVLAIDDPTRTSNCLAGVRSWQQCCRGASMRPWPLRAPERTSSENVPRPVTCREPDVAFANAAVSATFRPSLRSCRHCSRDLRCGIRALARRQYSWLRSSATNESCVGLPGPTAADYKRGVQRRIPCRDSQHRAASCCESSKLPMAFG